MRFLWRWVIFPRKEWQDMREVELAQLSRVKGQLEEARDFRARMAGLVGLADKLEKAVKFLEERGEDIATKDR